MTAAPLIELVGASAGFAATPVFAGLSLAVAEGSFLGIIGPTGGGKTTLLKALTGALPLLAGQRRLRSQPVRSLPPGSVGYLPQRRVADRAFPMTVRQLVAMGLPGRRPWLDRADRARVAAVLDDLALADCRDHPVSDLSGGQQQRAFLGRALVAGPGLLVLDEPTSDVDPQTGAMIRELLAGLHRGGTTILVSTHSVQDFALSLPELLLFDHGLLARGGPAEVVATSRRSQIALAG